MYGRKRRGSYMGSRKGSIQEGRVASGFGHTVYNNGLQPL